MDMGLPPGSKVCILNGPFKILQLGLETLKCNYHTVLVVHIGKNPQKMSNSMIHYKYGSAIWKHTVHYKGSPLKMGHFKFYHPVLKYWVMSTQCQLFTKIFRKIQTCTVTVGSQGSPQIKTISVVQILLFTKSCFSLKLQDSQNAILIFQSTSSTFYQIN